jgi:hypothetical protein
VRDKPPRGQFINFFLEFRLFSPILFIFPLWTGTSHTPGYIGFSNGLTNYWFLECTLHTTFHSGDGRCTTCYGSLAPIHITYACHCCYDAPTRNLDGATSPATSCTLFDHSGPRTHGASPHSALRIPSRMPSLYTWCHASPLRAMEAQSGTTTCHLSYSMFLQPAQRGPV